MQKTALTGRGIHCGFLLLLSSLGAVSMIWAQDDEGMDDTIYELSPFQVTAENDEGYRSLNTVSGTGLNIALRDLPMPIDVINEEFLDDTGAISFQDALAYASGVFTEQYTEASSGSRDGSNSPGANASYSRDQSASSRAGVGGRYSNSIIVRGFNVPFQNRDGFRYGGTIAQYGVVLGGTINTLNVERLEVVKGPNSLLYGIGVLSGIVNIIPKHPLSEPRASVSLSVGSYGFLRGTLDVTGPLKRNFFGGELNYRVATSQMQSDDWTDYRSEEESYYVGQLEYISPKWRVFVEGQYIESKTDGVGPKQIYDNLSAAIDRGFRNEYGEQYSWTRDYGGYDDSFRISGPDTYHNRREKDLLFTVDFTPIEDLSFQLGAFFTEAEETEFNLNLSTITRSERSFDMVAIRQRLVDPNLSESERERISDFFANVVEPFPAPQDLWVPTRTDNNDYRVVRYFWSREPSETTTQQYRARATYKFDSSLFDVDLRHTFLAGWHYIRDVADFATGTTRIDYQIVPGLELADNDPLIFRNVFDQSVIRYNGEMLAEPGYEYHQVRVTYTGSYALYQGQYWKDRIIFLGGVRYDRYESLDRVYDRHEPGGAELRDNPKNRTYGFLEDRTIRGPGSDGAEGVWTNLISLGGKLTDEISIYALRSEGITPNTGALDGNLEAIPSERSTSSEVGVKFEFLGGRVAGSVSVYRIDRENAIWNWENAPAPVKWVGGVIDPTDESDALEGFDPEMLTSGEASIGYSVDSSYFDFDVGKIITIDPDTGKRRLDFPTGVLNTADVFQDSIPPQRVVILEYENLDMPAIDASGNPTGYTWRHYIEKAFADTEKGRTLTQSQGGPNDIAPMVYYREKGTVYGINTSISSVIGSNVTYTDRAEGVDLQLFLKPMDNWQVILNYAHTEREAISAFDMASVAPFGTEYDVWVRTFGREAFGLEEHDDDGDGVVDRVTRDGQSLTVGDVDSTDLVGGLQGTSLFFGSEDEFSVWNKYSFDESVLDGLELGLGANYTGPAATSVEIGGSDLAVNRFRTPETRERWKFDAMARYRFSYRKLDFSITLNVYNLFDDRLGESVISYDDDGETILRRSRVVYAPRTFRVAARVDF